MELSIQDGISVQESVHDFPLLVKNDGKGKPKGFVNGAIPSVRKQIWM
jgi:hypothetical protein